MRIEGDWLDAAPLRAVLGMLEAAGHRGLIVGGAVRNAVMGLPVTDMDIATDARPERVMALAEAAGHRGIATTTACPTRTTTALCAPTTVKPTPMTTGWATRVTTASTRRTRIRPTATVTTLAMPVIRRHFAKNLPRVISSMLVPVAPPPMDFLRLH